MLVSVLEKLCSLVSSSPCARVFEFWSKMREVGV